MMIRTAMCAAARRVSVRDALLIGLLSWAGCNGSAPDDVFVDSNATRALVFVKADRAETLNEGGIVANLYVLQPISPNGQVRNLTQQTDAAISDPCISFDGTKVLFTDEWGGGTSPRALRRGIELCDGHQIIGVKPDEAAGLVATLRAARPDPEFTISLRTGWDPQGMDPAEIRDEHAAFAGAGVQHGVSAPWRSTLDDWLRSMELLAEIAGL